MLEKETKTIKRRNKIDLTHKPVFINPKIAETIHVEFVEY